MKMNLNNGIWTLKMKCIAYGLYGQVASKNARAILVFVARRNGQGAWASFRAAREGVPGVGPSLGRCELAGAGSQSPGFIMQWQPMGWCD
jgi:hypothetical protein